MPRAKKEAAFAAGSPTDYSNIVCTDKNFCRDTGTCIQDSSFTRQTQGLASPEEIVVIGLECAGLCSFFNDRWHYENSGNKPKSGRQKTLEELQVELIGVLATRDQEVPLGKRSLHPLTRRIVNLRNLIQARLQDEV